MKTIFLTGATGFLGTHLVKEFLNKKACTLICLIRSENTKAAAKKLEKAMDKYEMSLNESEWKHIQLVCGDLEKEKLGMTDEEYERVATEADVVFHNAAWVNWLLPAELLGRVNILGTRRMLALSNYKKNKKFYFVSSLSIFPFDGEDYEETTDIDQEFYLYGGYAQSKWLAEMVVQKAISDGKDAIIFRPNLITGRTKDGVFSRSAFFENCIKSFIQLKAAPKLAQTYMAVVPVDYVSQGMVQVVFDEETKQKVFHLSNAGYAAIGDIVDWVGDMGYEIEEMELEEWKHKLFASKDFYTNALYQFKPFVYGLEDGYMLMGKAYSKQTDTYMEKNEIVCHPIDQELVKTYVEYFVSSGFMEV